ncbi:hypothetical protein BJX66DRAFT_276629 [Aspergillus keveii]|uniref:Uncharacterized protein n=1 Tax=Aspergillus keveii TaxID=714993 RepID=A0ABR4GJD4_9EURO
MNLTSAYLLPLLHFYQGVTAKTASLLIWSSTAPAFYFFFYDYTRSNLELGTCRCLGDQAELPVFPVGEGIHTDRILLRVCPHAQQGQPLSRVGGLGISRLVNSRHAGSCCNATAS